MRQVQARACALGVMLAIAAGTACYQNPQERLDQMQQITDMSDAVNELALRTSELVFEVDSLRRVVARQDSVLATLANLAGVQYRR